MAATPIRTQRLPGEPPGRYTPVLPTVVFASFKGGVWKTSLAVATAERLAWAGLRVLLMAAKRIGKDNGRFLLCEVSQPVREVLEISGFLGMIEVVGSRDEALAEMPS